jgi:isoleucyl-tRNA synthetase
MNALIRKRRSLQVADLLPEDLRGEADKVVKGTDTMDVWFDSGSSWAGVTQLREGLRFPADLYLEGSDQHRCVLLVATHVLSRARVWQAGVYCSAA